MNFTRLTLKSDGKMHLFISFRRKMYKTNFNKATKLWTGDNQPPLYNPKVSTGFVIFKSLTVNGSKIAQISADSGIRMTYADIRLKTIRAAQNLQRRGYQKNQVFCFIAKNSHHLAPILIGSLCIGCTINTIDTSLGKVEFTHILKATKPNAVFCDVEVFDLAEECLIDLENTAKIFTFGGKSGNSEQVDNLLLETYDEDKFIPACVDGENDAALIVCSSGTSGLPKGVCLSHAALLDALMGLNIIHFDDIVLAFSSIYWLTGVISLLVGTLNGATRLITTEPFSTEMQLRLIKEYKVTYMMNATHQIILILKSDLIRNADLSSLREQYIGGSKLPFGVAVALNEYIPNARIQVSYGMSEVGGPISLGFPIISGNDSVGRLFNGSSVKIVDERGNLCDINMDGEICLKWNYKFLGYYNNTKATEELFDDEGFIKSGDIGHFDEDGYLYVVDRKKDLIKYFNFHISPTDIEAFLIEIPEIESVCVVGIPDKMGNDLPAAVVVPRDRFRINEKRICESVACHFADHSKLRGGVYFADFLPTTPSGKILRRKVKELATEFYATVQDIN